MILDKDGGVSVPGSRWADTLSTDWSSSHITTGEGIDLKFCHDLIFGPITSQHGIIPMRPNSTGTRIHAGVPKTWGMVCNFSCKHSFSCIGSSCQNSFLTTVGRDNKPLDSRILLSQLLQAEEHESDIHEPDRPVHPKRLWLHRDCQVKDGDGKVWPCMKRSAAGANGHACIHCCHKPDLRHTRHSQSSTQWQLIRRCDEHKYKDHPNFDATNRTLGRKEHQDESTAPWLFR